MFSLQRVIHILKEKINNHIHIFSSSGHSHPSGTWDQDCLLKRGSTQHRQGGWKTKIYISNFPPCFQSSITSQTGLPAGVYMLVRHNGSKAVLIVKAESSEATARNCPDKTQAAKIRTLTLANPTSTAGRTVSPKIIKPTGTMKFSGSNTVRRPVPQDYRTPLQVFS